MRPRFRKVPGALGDRTIITLRDVTDRRRSDKRRLDFYSIVAHDLRSPLQSMTLRTEVIDSGPGIPVDERATLFERFTRGNRSPTDAGTGLGLMIVQQLVEAHGGNVGVESEVGSGSRFWFEIPDAL